MNDKAAEEMMLAADELNQKADSLFAATLRLEREAKKLLEAVRLCFPQQPEAPKKQPALFFQPPANDWLH